MPFEPRPSLRRGAPLARRHHAAGLCLQADRRQLPQGADALRLRDCSPPHQADTDGAWLQGGAGHERLHHSGAQGTRGLGRGSCSCGEPEIKTKGTRLRSRIWATSTAARKRRRQTLVPIGTCSLGGPLYKKINGFGRRFRAGARRSAFWPPSTARSCRSPVRTAENCRDGTNSAGTGDAGFWASAFDGVDGPTSAPSKCQGWPLERHKRGRPSMNKFIRIGIDLGKNHFQVHALESEDGRVRTRKLSRQAMRKFFSEIEPCFVGMEPALHRIIGRANFWRWVTTCDLSRLFTLSPVSNAARTTRPTRQRSARPCHGPACGSFRSRAKRAKRH
jgi:hypothetical protein